MGGKKSQLEIPHTTPAVPTYRDVEIFLVEKKQVVEIQQEPMLFPISVISENQRQNPSGQLLFANC
jgi:hypothetical protein